MTNDELKNNEFRIMKELWAAYKKYYEPRNDYEMEQMFTEIPEIYNRYPTQLCMDLMNAFVNDIIRRNKHEDSSND